MFPGAKLTESAESASIYFASFFSAPGYREIADGALSDVGNGGYGWSSTVCSTNGMNWHFGVTWFNPSATHFRGYGFQLRCLSE